MKLPNNEIGISDLLAHRDCPRRMGYGMRRHLDTGEAPDAQSPATAYGSAIHDAIHEVEEEALTHQEAVDMVFRKWGGWLDPADVQRLFRDLDTFEGRDFRGVRTLAQEDDKRVPLMEFEGETIYFRFKLDKLYQRVSNPTSFIHIDYKSSRYAKSQEEVDEDPQMWAYNWGIYEMWPEVESLIQVYDQLRYGTLTTRKSDEQRGEIRTWLQTAARAVLLDNENRPRFNRWCPWCPIAYDCPVIPKLSDYALSRIGVLAPTVKDGRKKVVSLDPALYDVYVKELPKIAIARQTLEKVEKSIRETLKDMPQERLSDYGFTPEYRSATVFTAEGLRALHERVGDDLFYAMIGLTKTRLESTLSDDPDALQDALGMAEQRDGAVVLRGGPQLE